MIGVRMADQARCPLVGLLDSQSKVTFDTVRSAAAGVVLQAGGRVIVLLGESGQGENRRITMARIALAAVHDTVDVFGNIIEGAVIIDM